VTFGTRQRGTERNTDNGYAVYDSSESGLWVSKNGIFNMNNMDAYKTLEVLHDAGIVQITLGRSREANAVNRQMASELARIAHQCEFSTGVHAVILTGSGRFFCAGGDINEMASFGDQAASEVKLLVEDFHQCISSFSRMQAPLIVAVNGHAAGAGFSLAASADLVVSCEEATFTMAYTAAGLSPDGSSTYFLPRTIGLRRTQELMLTNRRLTAREALAWGLITRVTSAQELMVCAHEWAGTLSRGSLSSHGWVKELLASSFSNGLETQMALEARGIASSVVSPDGREGVAAFLGKRAPVFPR